MKKRALLLLLILLVGGAFIAKQQVAYRSEAEKIKARHREFIKAGKSEDPQAINSFIAPTHFQAKRTSFDWIKGRSGPDRGT